MLLIFMAINQSVLMIKLVSLYVIFDEDAVYIFVNSMTRENKHCSDEITF